MIESLSPTSTVSQEIGLYVHIPFCEKRCDYCDFATFSDADSYIDSYLTALIKEAEFFPRHQVKTFFIGGGTPSVLSVSQIKYLFEGLQKHFDFSAGKEISVEMNPESATDEKLAAFKNQGVNRISFGLQTTTNDLLQKLGRLHSVETFHRVYQAARHLGFKNINVDLMYGLPGQTLDAWKETLAVISDLSPEHISAYGLKVEEGTPFYTRKVLVDGDLQADMYLYASEYFQKKGFIHYEISNFSKPGFDCAHNLKYWENEPTLGLGLSSASYMDGNRTKNTRSLKDYMDKVNQGVKPWMENVVLPAVESEKENIMLSLRTRKGVPSDSLGMIPENILKNFLQGGLASLSKGMYRLTPQGWLMSNQLFQYLV